MNKNTVKIRLMENKTIVEFIMGELFIEKYGISRKGAAVDTVGVDPDYQGRVLVKN